MDNPKLRVYVRGSCITSEQKRDLGDLDFISVRYHKSTKRLPDGSLRETDERDSILTLSTKDVENADVLVILTPTPEFIHHSVCIELGAALVRKVPVLILTGDAPTDKESLDVYSRIYGVWLCEPDGGWNSILEKIKEIHKQRSFERKLDQGNDFLKRHGC